MNSLHFSGVKSRDRRRAGVLINLLIVVLGGGLILLYLHYEDHIDLPFLEKKTKPVAEEPPMEPIGDEVEEVEEEMVRSEPVIEPVESVEPVDETPPSASEETVPYEEREEDADEGLSLETVIAEKSLWPEEVTLVEATEFPIEVNGEKIGSSKRMSGTIVKVVHLTPETITVRAGTHETVLRHDQTDVFARIEEAQDAGDEETADVAGGVESRTQGNTSAGFSASPRRTPSRVSSPATESAAESNGDFKRDIEIIAVPVRKTRVEGGDYDDRLERSTVRIDFNNSSLNETYTADVEIWVFAVSVLSRRSYRLLGTDEWSGVEIPPGRNAASRESKEFQSAYDRTGAKFGYRYYAWAARVKDAKSGAVVETASQTWLEDGSDQWDGLSPDKDFNREFNQADPLR